MRSFEHGYLLEQPISQNLLMTVRALGEHRGRQGLYREQSPELLETLKRVAMIQSVESSNRIEGVTVAADRLEAIVAKKTSPKGRSEQEVAGYRDVLASIHANANRMILTPELILRLHRQMYARTPDRGGAWKEKENAVLEVLPDGRRVIRFRPVSALATPEFIESLCTFYHDAMDQRQAEPLLLIGSFIQSSHGWQEAKHDLRPWWNYFLGTLIAAYREFEERVGTIITARGAKREMVRQIVSRLSDQFSLREVRQACPGVSPDMVRLVLRELQKENLVTCTGRGPGAIWKKRGNIPKRA